MKNYIWLIAAALVLVAMVGWRVVPGMVGGDKPQPTPTLTCPQ